MKAFLILLIVFFAGCSVSKDSAKKHVMNESQVNEYNFNFTEGTKYKLLGNKSQAILCFIRCIELNPASSAVLFQLSEIYASNGDLRTALNFAKKAYNSDKKNQWYALHLAKLFQANESIDTAIVLYNQLLENYPQKEDYYLNLSFLYFKKNKPEKSIKILNEYQDRFGLTENVILTQYQIFKYIKSDAKCLDLLRRAVNLYPDQTRFYGLLAEHFTTMNQMDSALFYYNRLLEMEPENDRGILSLIEYYKTNLDSGNVMKYFKKFINIPDNALEDKVELISSFISDNNFRIKCSKDLMHITDSLINVNPNSENLYLLKADFYLRNKDNFNAKETLVYIISNFKANYVIWEQLLFTLNFLMLNDDLKLYSSKALSLFSDKPIVYLFNGIAHYNLKNYSESIQSLTKGLNYIKDKKEVAIQIHTYLGENYQAIANYAKSEFHFEKVLQYDPENIMVLNNYSYYLSLRNSQLDKAANYIKICISKFPNSSTYLDTYGWILYKSGNLSQAKTTIEKALQNGGQTNMEIIEHYSEVLYYYGDKTNAIKYYKILEENGKSNLSLKKLLEID